MSFFSRPRSLTTEYRRSASPGRCHVACLVHPSSFRLHPSSSDVPECPELSHFISAGPRPPPLGLQRMAYHVLRSSPMLSEAKSRLRRGHTLSQIVTHYFRGRCFWFILGRLSASPCRRVLPSTRWTCNIACNIACNIHVARPTPHHGRYRSEPPFPPCNIGATRCTKLVANLSTSPFSTYHVTTYYVSVSASPRLRVSASPPRPRVPVSPRPSLSAAIRNPQSDIRYSSEPAHLLPQYPPNRIPPQYLTHRGTPANNLRTCAIHIATSDF